MNHLITFSDGGSRGNPGPAGCGAAVCDEKGNVLERISKYIGITTNNQAEYQALILGLQAAEKLKPQRITSYLDSELIVKQLNGQYKIKKKELKPHYEWIKLFTLKYPLTRFIHIPREKNALADELANEAMDRG